MRGTACYREKCRQCKHPFWNGLNVLRSLDASDGYPLQQRTKIVCFEVVFLFPNSYTRSRD